MTDEIISAPSGGAPSSGDSGASPASSAPVSQPVSSPAAAPVVAQPAAPSGPPVKGPGEADDKFLARFHEYNDKQPKTGDELPVKVEEPKPIVAAEPVKPVEPIKPAEAVKTPEQIAAETKAAEDAKPKVENELDKLGPLPASKLAEALEKNPELEAILEENGLHKDDLFGALRTAAVAGQYQELFPDVETAKFAQGAAITMHRMDLAATELKPGDLASTQKFVQEVLMPMSFILDEKGEPKMREVKRGDGSVLQIPETDGTVSTMLNNFRDIALEQVLADADQLSKSNNEQHKELGERLLSAAQEIQNFIKGSDPNAAKDLPEELKAERARIDADRQALNTSRQQEADQRYETFKTGVLESTNSELDKIVNGWLEGSSLMPDPNDNQQVKESKEFIRNGVMREIRDGLFDKFNRNPLFLAEQEQIGRRGYSAATKAQLVNHYVRSANATLEKVAAPILAKAGYERVRQSAARATKIAAQEKLSKMEPQGATRPATPTVPKVDEKSLMAEARTQLRTELRRDPQPSEMIERFRVLVAKAATAVPA